MVHNVYKKCILFRTFWHVQGDRFGTGTLQPVIRKGSNDEGAICDSVDVNCHVPMSGRRRQFAYEPVRSKGLLTLIYAVAGCRIVVRFPRKTSRIVFRYAYLKMVRSLGQWRNMADKF